MSSRRRLLFIFLTLISVCLYLFVFSNKYDSAIQSLGFSSKSNQPSVDEIYGLISLVTRDSEKSQRVLTANSVDPSKPVAMNAYAARRGMSWEKEKERLNEEYPVVVFSKTYCPYSRKAKQLLQAYQLSPPPKIIEVDLREDAIQLKKVLTRLTGRSTFPNINLRGKSIGGSDDVHALHNANALRDMFKEAGVDVQGEYMM
ncbi:thioredoxin-like protein [Lentinula raphanica]|nr:thioredoxin-like protein [Lentinula raphanica]